MGIWRELKRRLWVIESAAELSKNSKVSEPSEVSEPIIPVELSVDEILGRGSVQPEEWHVLYNHVIENPKDRSVLRFIADQEYGQSFALAGVGDAAEEAEAEQFELLAACPSCMLFLRTGSNRCPKCGRIKEALKISHKEATACILTGGEMVRVPAGTFMMGSQTDEEGRHGNETLHEVKITRPFLMGTTPVTQVQWTSVMRKNPSRLKGYNLPVENVSWNDAIDFCNRLSAREGLTPAYRISGDNVTWDKGTDGYRLPTEAEWEYACRAGTTTSYYTGNSESDLDSAGWYGENSGRKTHPVGKKIPNIWGLYDMHGNMFEWCWDWYGEYPSNSVIDQAGPASGSYRVIRGGSWNPYAGGCRSADRYYYAPGYRRGYVGLRLLRPINP